MIVAITGHRPPKLGGYYLPNPIYLNVKAVLRTAFREQADRVSTGDELMILSGMALGVDQWAAEICIEERIKWTAVVPFHGWDSRWPDASRRHYQRLLNEADSVHVVTDTHEYRANLLYRRNAWMVDNASLLLAVWNGSVGGTANCIEYARRKRVRTEILPVPLEIWDQARALERPTPQRGGSQLLMEIFRPMTASPADEARMREQQDAARRTMLGAMQVPREFLQEAQQTRLLAGGREAEAARQQNLRAAMNVNNDIFYEQYTAAPEEPPTLPSVGDAAGSIAFAQRALAERLQGFVGERDTPQARARIEAEAQATMERLRRHGVMNVEATIRLPRAADYIGIDFAVGADETSRQYVDRNGISDEDLRNLYGEVLSADTGMAAVPQEPTQKEIITPEKRFLPGRIIDIED
jgi:uncharacterized phage-like protein YoqJ